MAELTEAERSFNAILKGVLSAQIQINLAINELQEARIDEEIVMWREREIAKKLAAAQLWLSQARDEIGLNLAGEVELEDTLKSIRRALESERSTEPSA